MAQFMPVCPYAEHMTDSSEKADAGEDWGQEEKGTIEDEVVGWHHQLDGHECE